MRRNTDGTVGDLRVRIERWRQTRKKLAPMPEKLWSAAVSLAGDRGVYPVARALKIDFGSLRRRLLMSAPEASGPIPRGFVELRPPASRMPIESAASETAVELSAADGAKLTFRFSGHVGPDVLKLAAAFWARQEHNRTQ